MKDFLNFLNKLENRFTSQILEVLKDTALEAERIAKQKAPVETGTLRRSITTKIDESSLTAFVGTNLLYALPLEKGAVIKPKSAKKLWIPVGKQTRKLVEMHGSVKAFVQFVLSKGGKVIPSPKKKHVRLVILNGQIIGVFALKDEVKIPAFRYFEQAFNEVYPKLNQKVNKIFGG